MQVYSIDCSIHTRYSKVYDKALGWFVATFVVGLAPSLPYYIMYLYSLVSNRHRRTAIILHRCRNPASRMAVTHACLKPNPDVNRMLVCRWFGQLPVCAII